MEALIVFAVIFVLFLCMGISVDLIALIFLVIMDIFLLAIFVFFAYCVTRLTGGKFKSARFIRIDQGRDDKFKTAYYMIDGNEYQNAFPAELIAKRIFYTKAKDKKVCLCKNGKVFDLNSLITIAVGLPLGAVSFIIMLIEIISSVNFH